MEKPKYISTVEADLLFTKINSIKKKKESKVTDAVISRMEFHEFMGALKHIGGQLYPDQDGDEGMLRLIQDRILPLEK